MNSLTRVMLVALVTFTTTMLIAAPGYLYCKVAGVETEIVFNGNECTSTSYFDKGSGNPIPGPDVCKSTSNSKSQCNYTTPVGGMYVVKSGTKVGSICNTSGDPGDQKYKDFDRATGNLCPK